MSALFYIGIVMVFLSFIPWFMINGRIMRDRERYENMPLKTSEIQADYKRKRFYLMLFQLTGVIIAIIGLSC